MVYLLHQLLSESAVKYPDKKAVIFENEFITYAQLENESNGLAHTLLATGVKKGDRVGIHLNRGINSIISVFGILKSGATYVPIDPLCPENRINYIVSKCQISYLLTSQDKLNHLEKSFPEDCPLDKIIIMKELDSNVSFKAKDKLIDWQKIKKNAIESAPNIAVIDSDLAYILFTSGSTGNPKGVMISHLNSLTFVNMAHDFFRIENNDIFSNNSPLHFDLSVFDIFVAFKAGASVVVVPESISMFPVKLAEFIEKNRISIWNSVPSVLSLLANYADLNKYNYPNLRLILFAGEVFPVKYMRRLKQSIPQAKFFNIYGQTEANSSTYYLVDNIPAEDSALIPIGKPFPNFEVFALDENGKKIVNAGEKGELYIRAASVAFGYWDESQKTSENFVKNPLSQHLDERIYKTGDIVRLDDKGNHIFLGRKDHMIKSRGYRIEIGEIETLLSNHPQVKAAVVIPVPDELIGNRIAVFIVPFDQNNLKKEDILKYCSKQLPKYMVPEIIMFRDKLHETSSGKADRKKLAEEIIRAH